MCKHDIKINKLLWSTPTHRSSSIRAHDHTTNHKREFLSAKKLKSTEEHKMRIFNMGHRKTEEQLHPSKKMQVMSKLNASSEEGCPERVAYDLDLHNG